MAILIGSLVGIWTGHRINGLNALTPAQAAHYRAGGMSVWGWKAETAVATGRSRCRACGEKIAKGEPCLTVAHDFTGADSCYAATKIAIHAHNCTGA